MGETLNQKFQLPFNASLKADFQGSRATSAGGLKVHSALLTVVPHD